MDILFVHTNFPGQFKLLAQALAGRPEHRIFAIGSRTARIVSGITVKRYGQQQASARQTHPFARRLDSESQRSEQIIYLANELKLSGMNPGLIFAHTGWGEALPLRQLFPNARIVAYCEHFYRATGADTGFDPEFPMHGIDGAVRIGMRNASTVLSLLDADIGITPTHWQRDGFPVPLRSKLKVIHDGVAIDQMVRTKGSVAHPATGRPFTPQDEIVTFVARTLEPYRGFHVFMRALPELQRLRPNAEICIIGNTSGGYGNPPVDAKTWKEWCLREMGDQLDLERIHFLGKVPYATYLACLRLSRAHVYLTYPFVLSWSLIEAMALGKTIIGSDTAPVREVLQDGKTGLLVPFFDTGRIARRIADVLADPERFKPLGQAAAAYARRHYDFQSVILPRFDAVIEDLLSADPEHHGLTDAKTWQGQELPHIRLRAQGNEEVFKSDRIGESGQVEPRTSQGEERSWHSNAHLQSS
jgi:glycosyltransferase involved in cell wall biosynthesis